MSDSPVTPPSDAPRPRPPALAGLCPPRRITVLSGGVGGARFLQGLLRLVERTGSDTAVTVIANTADDIWVHGLKVCPDLDTVMYTLGDGIDTEPRLGPHASETWHAKEELAAYGVEPTWFGLGDRDLATHLVRTQMLDAGFPLSAVTAALCRRWLPTSTAAGRAAPDVRRPGRDPRGDRRPGDRRAPGGALPGVLDPPPRRRRRARRRADRASTNAKPGPGVLEAIARRRPRARAAVEPGRLGRHDPRGPRHPRRARARPRAPVVGVSGIIGADHVHGMARQLLGVIGVEVSAAGVAEHYGARSAGGRARRLAGGHRRRGASVERVEAAGIRCRAVPLWMTDHDATADMVRRRARPGAMSDAPTWLEAWAVEGIGEIAEGTDLAALLVRRCDLRDGDVVLVTSKVVSKAEGRVRAGDREDGDPRGDRAGGRPPRPHLDRGEPPRPGDGRGRRGRLQRRPPGHVVLLPPDPDASARSLRERRARRGPGATWPCVVTDTAGRAWRTGQTDLAVGVAGLEPLDDHAGRTDSYGNPLAVTAPAVADELASVAELVTGKLGGRPVSVVRGLGERVLPAGRARPRRRARWSGPGTQDMFALGAREAVVAAVRGHGRRLLRRARPRRRGGPAPWRRAASPATVEGVSVRVQLPADRRARPGRGRRAGPAARPRPRLAAAQRRATRGRSRDQRHALTRRSVDSTSASTRARGGRVAKKNERDNERARSPSRCARSRRARSAAAAC